MVRARLCHVLYEDVMFRARWGQEMYERIHDTKWLYSVVQPIVANRVTAAEYNRDLNILFVKLHLLQPTLVVPAYHYLQKG